MSTEQVNKVDLSLGKQQPFRCSNNCVLGAHRFVLQRCIAARVSCILNRTQHLNESIFKGNVCGHSLSFQVLLLLLVLRFTAARVKVENLFADQK